MDNKAQGALEYLLLIGGAVLIAAVVITLLAASGALGSTTAVGSRHTYNAAIENIKTTLPS